MEIFILTSLKLDVRKLGSTTKSPKGKHHDRKANIQVI